MGILRGAPLARLGAAAPDAITAGVFLTTWLEPLRFGPHAVRNTLLVMMIEFIFIHMTVMLPLGLLYVLGKWSAAGSRWLLLAGLVTVYLFFVVALAFGFREWWPIAAFGWLLASKYSVLMPLGVDLGADRSGMMGKAWVASTLLWLAGAFLCTFVPLPELGIATVSSSQLDLVGTGIWVSDPQRPVAFGVFYFGMLAWAKWRFARPASIRSPEIRLDPTA